MFSAGQYRSTEKVIDNKRMKWIINQRYFWPKKGPIYLFIYKIKAKIFLRNVHL